MGLRIVRRGGTPLLILCMALFIIPAPVARAAEEIWRFEIAGQTRTVKVHVPPGRGDMPRRFVLLFHGLGDDNAQFSSVVRFHAAWPEAIVAYPNGERRPDRESKRGWQTRRGQYDDRDLHLVDALLAEASARYGIRPDRTHAAGFSNGGHMVFLLLAERPHAFASFGVVGAVRPDLAGATTPRPLMYLWGRGESREHRDAWAETIESMVRLNRTGGPLRDYARCCQLQLPQHQGAPVVFGLYNAGHVWPFRGNEWLKAFFGEDWDSRGTD
jgi:poly(3-hydroxybutyrate) depolymerase